MMGQVNRVMDSIRSGMRNVRENIRANEEDLRMLLENQRDDQVVPAPQNPVENEEASQEQNPNNASN